MRDIKKALEEKYPVPQKLSPENMSKLIEKEVAVKKRRKIRLITSVTAAAASFVLIFTLVVSLINGDDNEKIRYDEKASASVESSEAYEDFNTNEEFPENFPVHDESSEDIEAYKKLFGKIKKLADDYGTDFLVDEFVTNSQGPQTNTVPSEDGSSSDSKVDIYNTYEQVEGVSEADVIKTDGKYIYYISRGYIYVINLEGEVMSKVNTDYNIGLHDKNLSELYLVNNQLVYTNMQYGAENFEVRIFDISESGKLRCSSVYKQDGFCLTSRLIGDKLYLVSYDYLQNSEAADCDKPETYIPSYSVNTEEHLVAPENILIDDNCTTAGYAVIGCINISKPDKVNVKTVFTNRPEVYCSRENLYLMSNFYRYIDDEELDSDRIFPYRTQTKKCNITKIALNEKLDTVCEAVVDGHILNQFSADEYEGYLRIAVDRDYDNALLILDEGLETVGSVGDMGKGENIKSVRFDGEIGYVVTFRNTDPLYTVDLSNPKNPVVKDELKISGYSTHLREYRDGLMVGFGYEADETDGRSTGLKLSMFKADENGEQQEVSKIAILSNSDRYSYVASPAADNHKYLLISPDKNLIGFPYVARLGYYESYPNDTEDDCFKEKYVLYNYTENGFGTFAEIDVDTSDARAIYVGNVIYILGENRITLVDIENGKIIKENALN